ncbi:MAG: pyruvate kinase [Pseudomonadota bacterium]|nr:pyruvate kinase [Pseudomonadota bacterium]
MTRNPSLRRRMRQTRIVATLGPASASADMIRKLFDAGVDVFRLNFSHGKQEDHGERVRLIREVEKETGRPVCIMADLQGPKLRVGTFADGSIMLAAGQRFRLDLDQAPGDGRRVRLPHPEILQALRPGANLLLDDGKIRLKVLECGSDFAETEVVIGGKLSDRKGVNVPDVVIPLSPLTPKDREDLRYALDAGVDWIALSFVQKPDDIAEARKLIGNRAALLAKIEKPSAITHLTEIVQMSDGLMVARGDLGVEMPTEDVPALQKRILKESRLAGRPVIVATQMLESMISTPTPTRAEASDVATAVYDGADAVMLSAETASGQYPLEAVSIMDRIIRRTESDPSYRTIIDAWHLEPQHTSADAITAAARQVSETISAACIATFTESGSTTLRAARERPAVPILCLASRPEIARRLTMAFGVHAFWTTDIVTEADMVQKACAIARQDGLAAVGQKIVITAGVPFGKPGTTNLLRIARIEE